MRRPRMVRHGNPAPSPRASDGHDGHPDGWSAALALDLAELLELGVEVGGRRPARSRP
jgi:hypothetical protein